MPLPPDPRTSSPSWEDGPSARSQLLRAGAAVLVVIVVIALVALDRRDQPAPAARVTAPTGVVTTDQPTPTVAPTATPSRDHAKRRKQAERRKAHQRALAAAERARVELASCQQQTVPRDITVLSFNTHRSFGQDGLARAAGEIERADADVVLLQEIDRFHGRTGGVDQAGWFAERLGMQWAFGANVISGSGQYGTAVLSDFPIVDWDNTLLPNGPGGEQRGLLRATLDLGGEQRLNVYNTHLQNKIESLRIAQARTIAGILAQDPLPKVLGGDLNAGPGSPPIRTLETQVTDSWPLVGSGPGFTAPGTRPRWRIDYLMASSDVEPLASQVLPSAVSDHSGVRTSYRVAVGRDCSRARTMVARTKSRVRSASVGRR